MNQDMMCIIFALGVMTVNLTPIFITQNVNKNYNYNKICLAHTKYQYH